MKTRSYKKVTQTRKCKKPFPTRNNGKFIHIKQEETDFFVNIFGMLKNKIAVGVGYFSKTAMDALENILENTSA